MGLAVFGCGNGGDSEGEAAVAEQWETLEGEGRGSGRLEWM